MFIYNNINYICIYCELPIEIKPDQPINLRIICF